MSSYHVKTQRTQIRVQSPYTKKICYLATLTEYSVSLSKVEQVLKVNRDSSSQTGYQRIEDQIPSLFDERQRYSNKLEVETFLKKTIPDLSNLALAKNNETIDQSCDNDDEGKKEGVYMDQMPDEIIMMLLKYADGIDRVNLGSTCKRFRHLLLHSGLIWKSRCVSWGLNSHQYAVLAPQIEKLVIVMSAWEILDAFCLDLFSQEKTCTRIIHIIQPEMVGENKPLVCWLRSEQLYQKYEIYPHTGYLSLMSSE